MAEVLSQTEIDALLSAVSTGAVETKEAPPPPGTKKGADWIAYDLTSQEKVVRGRLVGLQGIHERFARLFRVSLSNSLKKSVTVNMTNIDFIRFGDYLSNILLPTSINVFQMTELQGNVLFVVSSKFAYALMDAYYGGNERPFSKIGGSEEFTSIENKLIKKIADQAISDLTEAWKLNYSMKLEYQRSESNPHFVGCIHASELVAVVSFDVEFDSLSGPFVMIVQLRALDPIQSSVAVNVTGELADDANAWQDHWMSELMTTELDVKVELGEIYRSLRQVQELKVGEELILNQDHASPLAVTVQELAKFYGIMGSFRGAKAIRLLTDLGFPEKPVNDSTEMKNNPLTKSEEKNG